MKPFRGAGNQYLCYGGGVGGLASAPVTPSAPQPGGAVLNNPDAVIGRVCGWPDTIYGHLAVQRAAAMFVLTGFATPEPQTAMRRRNKGLRRPRRVT